MKQIIISLLCLLLFGKATAQLPLLETWENNKYSVSGEIELQSLNVDVKVFENISVTKMTMVFVNHSHRTLEGRLTFPLPDGTSISGFALDINGVLRKAVPVEKEKATAVFESIERRKVDPGILEKTEGNNFRTRIYPLPANEGVRTIEIVFQQELKMEQDKLEYYLPLLLKNYKKFNLHVTVFDHNKQPELKERPDNSFDFIKNGQVWSATIDKENFKPQNSIKINIPITDFKANSILQKRNAEEYYFLTTVKIPEHDSAPYFLPKKIGILWDNSLSRTNADLTKEKEFLQQYLQSNRNVNIDFVTFSTKFRKINKVKIRNGDIRKLFQLIDQIQYDGGTDFSVFQQMNVNEYFIFSDGLSTFGDLKMVFQKPVHTIVSNSVADFSQLKFISNQTGGRFINLNETSSAQAVNILQNKPYRFLGINPNVSIYDWYPTANECTGQFMTIAGKTKNANATLELNFGYDTDKQQKTVVALNTSQITTDWDVDRFWAQKKLSKLEVFYEKNKIEIGDLGKQYGIVTKNSSLIVLESLNDYIRYKIPPPPELKAEYDERMADQKEDKNDQTRDLLENARDMMETLKKWHGTDFIALAKQRRIDSISRAVAKAKADYIRMVNEKRIADSIRVADSIKLVIAKRATDSMHIVDSTRMVNQQRIDKLRADSINIVIRGAGSVSGGNEPLVVVDGEPYTGDISQLDKNKIKSINVLKDITSTSLYGARGSNGVVLITTKKNNVATGSSPGLQVNNTPQSSNTLEEVVITTPYGPPVTKQNYVGSADVITASKIEMRPTTGRSNVFEINSSAAYIKELEQATSSKDAYKLYLKLRPDYYSTPTFYFDVANWFFNKKEIETGVQILSNLAELDLENAEIYKTIAYTLKKYNQKEKLLYITNKVLQWRPLDPQSYRDYALALEDNGQYQKALETLYAALLQDYTAETQNRDKGIEETILLEINQLISLHRKELDIQKIDSNLVADIPVDIRVVLNWNLDNVDVDLHIIDPNKEECFYGHTSTVIGGRISDDFTDGFGPEQFILKHAVKGKYQIKTDYFAETRVSGSGRTTLMAEVYLYYGTGKEERKIVVFQSAKNNDDTEDNSNNNKDVLIGEFEF